jgi:nitroreductase
MDAIKALMNHRTIRKFKSDPIDDALLHKILEAGFRASTTGNMQVYSVIVTRDVKKRQKLWDYHFKQNMVLQAPLLLTFCADFNRFGQWCRQRKAEPGFDNFLSFTTAAIDALLVAQNVAIAAEALGLGICYLGTTTYNADKLVDFFGCPESVVPITTLVVGYPDEKPKLTDRLPFDAMVHYEKYKPYTAKDIDDIYAEKENLPLTAQLLEENQLENLAQIFTKKRYTKKDNVNYSRSFLRLLTKQGFMGF